MCCSVPPWGGVPTLAGGYLPWTGGRGGGESVPILDRDTYLGRGYLPWPRGYLPWTGGTYLGGGTTMEGGTLPHDALDLVRKLGPPFLQESPREGSARKDWSRRPPLFPKLRGTPNQS